MLRVKPAAAQCARRGGASHSGVTIKRNAAERAHRRPASRACTVRASVAAVTTASAEQQEEEQQQPTRRLRLRSAAAYLPHPDKEHLGGEDAHFVSVVGGGALGVADGVGGWAESGVNPAAYSRTLMRVAVAYIEGTCTASAARSSVDDASAVDLDAAAIAAAASAAAAAVPPAALAAALNSLDGDEAAAATATVDPRAALDAAHRLTRLPGSATAVIVQLCPERRALVAANLGDSGFLVLRKSDDGSGASTVVLRSAPLQHYFDCPLQLGAFPEHVEATDSADQADVYALPVRAGDVVVAGSDGLWDNVYEADVVAAVAQHSGGDGGGDVRGAAEALAALARRNAADERYESPYVREALAQGLDWPWWMKLQETRWVEGEGLRVGRLEGGKMDDITVLVAVVVEE